MAGVQILTAPSVDGGQSNDFTSRHGRWTPCSISPFGESDRVFGPRLSGWEELERGIEIGSGEDRRRGEGAGGRGFVLDRSRGLQSGGAGN